MSLEESVNTLLELVLPIVGKKGEKNIIHCKMEENYKLGHLKELEASLSISFVKWQLNLRILLCFIVLVKIRLSWYVWQKAFYPGKVPFPLMHIDSKWKFKEMIVP